VPKIADGRAPRDGALVCRQLAPHSHKADTTDFTTKATTNNSLNHNVGELAKWSVANALDDGKQKG
jgi:hypothetical protein